MIIDLFFKLCEDFVVLIEYIGFVDFFVGIDFFLMYVIIIDYLW